MKNVLLLYLIYPLAMGTYFRRALERKQQRGDIFLVVAGPYSGTYIPWLGGMNLPVKYANPPEIPLAYPPSGQTISYDYVKRSFPEGWKPDLVLCVDAGIHWDSKPTDGIVAHVATDPHVLDYTEQRHMSDIFFNMQKIYSQPADIWLPYAFDPTIWYPVDGERDYDACLIGMPYPQRVEWVARLQSKGLRVAFENGPVFDEARGWYNRSKIGLNWSSLLDLNARVFELMGMGLPPVINRVPDLPELFTEGVDYLGFDGLEEAVSQVMYLKNHPDFADALGRHAYAAVQEHTYDERINQIFEECGI